MEITKDILYVGVNDHLVDLFEGQYDVPNGMAYNSYLICDNKRRCPFYRRVDHQDRRRTGRAHARLLGRAAHGA